MRVKVRHSTEYTYDQAVSRGLQKIRLTPKNSGGQTVVSWHTGVEGGAKELSYTDQHNNLVELLSIAPGTRTVTIVCEGEVDTSDTSRILPDEDWLGKNILAYLEGERSYGEPEDVQRALGLLGEEFVAEARSMLEYAASDDWRIGSPVAKEAISGLSRTKAGRELLARFAESADTVAYRGSPRVVRVWKHGTGSGFKRVEVPESSWPELTRQLGGQKAVRRETLGRRLR